MAIDRFRTFCRQNPVLAAIIGVGFLLRVSGLFWGLPVLDPDAGFYHPDETFIFDLAIFTFGVAAPAEALGYPMFFAALLGMLTLPVRLCLDPFTDYETFLLIVAVAGRACSVAAGTAAIYFTHQLAVELGARRAEALLAASLLTFSLYHAQNSAFGTTDVLTSLLLVIFLLFVRRGFVEGSQRAFVRAGVALGLLVGTKYTGVLAVVAVPLFYGYHLLRSWQGQASSPPGRAPAPPIGHLLLCGVVSVLTFAITTPGPFIHLPSFLRLMQAVASETGWTGTTWNDPAAWSRTYDLVVVALGWPLTWLMLFGFVFPVRRSVYHFGTAAIVLTLFVYFGRTLYARYVIMVAPLIAIIASHGIMTLCERARRVHLQAVPVMVAVAVLTYSIGYCVVGAYLRHADTRSQAARYLRESFPPGTSVGFGYVSIQRTLDEFPRWMTPHADFSATSPLEMPQLATLWDLPRVDFDTFQYVDLLDYPDVVLMSSPVFDQIRSALPSEKLSPDYVWDPRHNAEWYRSLPPEPRVFAFYARLLDPERSPYTLARVFSKPMPVPIEFGSPEVRVYVLSPEARVYQRERVALSFANVHYYPPYSTTETRFRADPWGYFDELDSRSETWSLAVSDGSVARVEFPSEEPRALHVVIDRADPVTAWHVQLNQVGLPLRQGARYALNFRARAIEPRQIAAAVSRAYGTRENLGLYQFADVGPEWQSFRYEFVATADDASGRIHFDLGRSDVDVTVDAVYLHEIDDEGNVVPVVSRPPVYGVQYRFNGMGCRGRDYEIPTPARVRRVLVLGNSWALGAGVHEEDTFSARLESLLNEAGTAAVRYEVINCGVDGYDVRKARQFYELMASRYGASVVLLLVAPAPFDAQVDVARVFVPRVRDDNSGSGSPANRRYLDADATVDQIVQLKGAVSAQDAALGVLLARGDGNAQWTAFVGAVGSALERASVRAAPLDSFFPAGVAPDLLLVLPGIDARPNHVAHDRAAREIVQLLENW